MLWELVLGAGGEAGRQCEHLGVVQTGACEAWEVGAVRVHQDELADGVAGCGEKGVLPSSSRCQACGHCFRPFLFVESPPRQDESPYLVAEMAKALVG